MHDHFSMAIIWNEFVLMFIPVLCDQVMDEDGELKLCKVGCNTKSHTTTECHECFRPWMQFFSLFSDFIWGKKKKEMKPTNHNTYNFD